MSNGIRFCEVAGALDMLYDGPGGWDIKPYWWERDDYSDQQKWCKVCGARLSLPMSNDNDDFDYITESILRKLISKKLRIKKHKIITKKDYEMYEDIWENKKREQLNTISEIHISNDNKNIKPISIDIINDESLIHNYNDWVIIGKNINTCNKLKSILSNAVINQGYAYCYDDCYAINVLSQVMINNNINDNFLSLFDKNKIINVKNMQHKTYINYNVQNTKWKDVKNINNILTHLK
jgi:hypothetical protein